PEPIAILAHASRWPSASTSTSTSTSTTGTPTTSRTLWPLLTSSHTTTSPFPATKFANTSFHHPSPSRAGSFTTAGGHFLPPSFDTDAFDAALFSLHPAEARAMDPSQKLLLETVYAALEAAGACPLAGRGGGRDTGVWVANMNTDHTLRAMRDSEYLSPYSATGMSASLLANRISYIFDFHGPSVTIDTACSSSLYALHLAVRALRGGECAAAVVGGVNVILTPDVQIGTDRLGALGKDGVCYTFDERAEGYARAEGVGVVVLKRLSDAVRDGDDVRAVVRGSAVGANGFTGLGITHPSAAGQAATIRAAYRDAGIPLDACGTGYVEAHGTGTPVGDVVEVEGLGLVFGDAMRKEGREMLIGSIKPNLGHAEAAAGIAGVLKGVAILEHGEIPPTRGVERWNPKIPFEASAVKVVTQLTPLPEPIPGLRRVGVNSFGYGGANAHVILDAFSPPSTFNSDTTDVPQLLLISAHVRTALAGNIAALSALSLPASADLAFTLATKRTPHRERSFLPPSATEWAPAVTAPIKPAEVAFVFTGQGAQWTGMGASPLLLPRLHQLESSLSDLGESIPLVALLTDTEDDRILQPQWSQPCCTAVQIALVDLLANWGVKPTKVVGHSSGEIAAAYAAGLMSADAAMLVALYRGRAVTTGSTPRGAMLAVGLGADAASKYLIRGVVVAAVNSPSSVTLSGDAAAIDTIADRLKGDGVFARLLKTGGMAYHSAHMLPVGESYETALSAALGRLPPTTTTSGRKVEFYSSVTGALITPDVRVDAGYWRCNLVSPVLFSSALTALGGGTLLEIGPHPALHGPARQCLDGVAHTYIPTLTRTTTPTAALLSTLGALWQHSHITTSTVDAANATLLPPGAAALRCMVRDLPEYAFTRIHYSNELRASKEWRLRQFPRHDILGSQVPGGDGGTWRNRLSIAQLPWLAEHALGKDGAVFPAAGYVAAAVEAARQRIGEGLGWVLRDVKIDTALTIPDDGAVEVVTTLAQRDGQSWEWRVTSVADDGTCTAHARGEIRQYAVTTDAASPPCVSPTPCLTASTAKTWYTAFTSAGLRYGASFQRLSHLRGAGTHAELDLAPAMAHESRYVLHPAALDGMLQLGLIAGHHGVVEGFDAFVPVSIGSIVLHGGATVETATATAVAERVVRAPFRGLAAGRLSLVHPDTGELLAELRDVRCIDYAGAPAHAAAAPVPYHKTVFHPDIATLSQSAAWRLFPPPADESLLDAYKQLEELSLLLLAELCTGPGAGLITDLSFTPDDADMASLQRWIRGTFHDTEERCDGLPTMATLLRLTPAERTARIETLTSAPALAALPETAMILRITSALPSLLTGAQTGLQLALADDLLTRLYSSQSILYPAYTQLHHIVSLLSHQRAGLDVLEIGAGTGGATRHVLDALDGTHGKYVFTDVSSRFLAAAAEEFAAVPRMEFGVFDMLSPASDQAIFSDLSSSSYTKFDVIVASQVLHVAPDVRAALRNLRALLKPGGRLVLVETTREFAQTSLLLGTFPGYWREPSDGGRPTGPFLSATEWEEVLDGNGFGGVNIALGNFCEPWEMMRVLLAEAVEEAVDEPETQPETERLTLVHLHAPTRLATTVAAAHTEPVEHCSLLSLPPVLGRVVVLTDLEHAILPALTSELLAALQHLTRAAKSVLWVSLDSPPSIAPALLRTITQENPNTRLATLSLDCTTSAEAVSSILQCVFATVADKEHALINGVLHTPRLVPDRGLNAAVAPPTTRLTPLHALPRSTLAIATPGTVSSVYFTPAAPVPLPDGFVELRVLAQGVNLKDSVTITGALPNMVDSVHEFTGIITALSDSTTELAIGDRVLCLYPARTGTHILAPASLCVKLRRTESATALAGLPLAWCTALHAMRCAQVAPGDKVLVMSAASATGIAAVALALREGAEVWCTVGATGDAGRAYLQSEYGIGSERCFVSRDMGARQAMLDATAGQGFDVVISTASGEYLRDVVLPCVAACGRVVDVGRVDVLDGGNMDMSAFKRNMAFVSFDGAVLARERPGVVGGLLRDVIEMYRNGEIKLLHTIEYGVADIADAVQRSFRKAHVGKIIVSWANPDSLLPFRPAAPMPSYDPSASYLLLGGLGGLGISLSRHLVAHGARHLVYLSRSQPSPAAAAVLATLTAAGCKTTLLLGDIALPADAQRAVAAAGPRLRGVIHAAMVRTGGLFHSAKVAEFAAALAPKYTGVHNLAAALGDQALDFLLLLSSLTATLGLPGLGSYITANAALDAFASACASAGIAATSVQLGMLTEIGTLSTDTDDVARNALLRGSCYPIAERELLALVAPLLRGCASRGVVTTCLDPARLAGPVASQPSGWHKDARMGRVVHAARLAAAGADHTSATRTRALDGAETTEAAIAAKLAALLYVDRNKLEADRPLAELGLDSIIAAEFRNWLWKACGVEVGFLELV
ncbi:hypothetical protein EDC01DRAFT_763542, partial [Geopyxis carbonaria]